MKTNPRELAIEITGWVVAKGIPIDTDGYSIGASAGQLVKQLMAYRNNTPARETEGERRRRRFLHKDKLRAILGQAIIGALHYAQVRGSFLSFEESENYARGVEHEKFETLLAFLFQNVSSVYQANTSFKEDVEKDPGGEVFFRVGAQRYLNTIFAIIANLELGDPIVDVLEPQWELHAN